MTQVASRALKKVGKGTAEKTSLQNMHKNMYSKFLWHLTSQKSDSFILHFGWTRGSVVRKSVFGWRTFTDLCLIYGWHVTNL